jgi:hypothetical protein
MADFPALTPSSRGYALAEFPVTEERGFGGGNVRFKHGNLGYSFQLRLNYVALSQADASLIRDHYRTQQGGFISFDLSSDVWLGHDDISGLAPLNVAWRYAAPIEETHRIEGRIDISVTLSSVPRRQSGFGIGLLASISASLNAGSASAS